MSGVYPAMGFFVMFFVMILGVLLWTLEDFFQHEKEAVGLAVAVGAILFLAFL